MTRQLSNSVFNKYMNLLQSSAPLTKRELASLKSVLNFKANFGQLNMLLSAAEQCGCIVDGASRLVGFTTQNTLYMDTVFVPILVPIEVPQASLSLQRPVHAS